MPQLGGVGVQKDKNASATVPGYGRHRRHLGPLRASCENRTHDLFLTMRSHRPVLALTGPVHGVPIGLRP